MPDRPRVLAMVAHPDDIEFMMSGTMMLLRDQGWELHYLNIGNGCYGTAVDPPEVSARKRLEESREACALVGATHHESLCDDLAIFYNEEMIHKAMSPIRQVRPRILLLQSPQDYMEDHQNAARIAVTAAFCRGMPYYGSDPPVAPITDEVTVYHALPYGLTDPFRQPVRSGQYVDVTSVIGEKRRMLACHRSQKEWLDASQGLDAYLDTMEGFTRQVGEMSGRFECAEGWRRRVHLGLSAADGDPLGEALGERCWSEEG